VVCEIDPCLPTSCSSAVCCELEQPKVWCLVVVLFVFVRVYFLHLFSDHAAVFSKIKLMNRKLCTSWFVTRSLLVNDKLRNVMFLEKNNYHETIHDEKTLSRIVS